MTKPVDGTHLDEHANPCSHHATPPLESLLALATVGSRASGFNHDIASKLQGLMMALDEIAELADGLAGASRGPLTTATEGAQASLKDILSILNTNRAMTKPPMRAPVALSELTTRAGERVYLTLRGALPDVDISVSAPTATHALSLIFDLAGGPGRGRTLPVEATRTATHVSLIIPIAGTLSAPSGENITIASYVLARDGGALRCANSGQQFVIDLLIA